MHARCECASHNFKKPLSDQCVVLSQVASFGQCEASLGPVLFIQLEKPSRTKNLVCVVASWDGKVGLLHPVTGERAHVHDCAGLACDHHCWGCSRESPSIDAPPSLRKVRWDTQHDRRNAC